MRAWWLLLLPCVVPLPALAAPPPRVLWLATAPEDCAIQLDNRQLTVRACTGHAEQAVARAFTPVATEQGWPFDVVVREMRLDRQPQTLEIALVLQVVEQGQRKPLLQAIGRGQVLLAPDLTSDAFSQRLLEAFATAAEDGVRLLRNRVSLPPAEVPPRTWWLGLEPRVERRPTGTVLAPGLAVQRRMSPRLLLLLAGNVGYPSPSVEAGPRVDLMTEGPLTWQADAGLGVEFPAWWRETCRVSECKARGDLGERAKRGYVRLATGLRVVLAERHELRIDAGMRTGIEWPATAAATSFARGLFSLGYAFGF